jgi:glycosyltransferase involved in cell wall biosynthesis
MPLYNGEKYLDAAISSVVAQTFIHWHLYIVNDGSKDNSYAKARAWSARDARIFVLQHTNRLNKGVSASRNLGIQQSSSEFIALIDCDDVWLPEKLSKQIDVLKTNANVGLAYSEAQVIDQQGNLVNGVQDQYIKRPAIFGAAPCIMQPFNGMQAFLSNEIFWVPVSTPECRRRVLEKIPLFNEALHYQLEDTLFFLNIAAVFDCIFIKEPLAFYRTHAAQWNAKRNANTEAHGLFQMGICLIEQNNNNYQAQLQQSFLNNNFRRLCAYNKNFEKNYFRKAWPFLKKIFKLKGTPMRFKLKAVGMFFLYAIIPLKKQKKL